MADNHTPQQRSFNMSHIRSKNTKPEDIVRKFLFSQGFRYRKNVKKLPGCPDVVLPKYKTVIFVNGCFWHMHNCDRFRLPTSNTEYWSKKLKNNVSRDAKNVSDLQRLGWKVLTIWECELKHTCRETTLRNLSDMIKNNHLDLQSHAVLSVDNNIDNTGG